MEQGKRKTNLVQERSYFFGLKVIKLYHTLSKQGEFILSKQLARSGTGIGTNVEEALATLLHITNPSPTLREKYERINVGGMATVVDAAILLMDFWNNV